MRSDFDGRFTLRAAYNDLTLAHNLARQFGVPLLTTLPALEEMKATMDRDWAAGMRPKPWPSMKTAPASAPGPDCDSTRRRMVSAALP